MKTATDAKRFIKESNAAMEVEKGFRQRLKKYLLLECDVARAKAHYAHIQHKNQPTSIKWKTDFDAKKAVFDYLKLKLKLLGFEWRASCQV